MNETSSAALQQDKQDTVLSARHEAALCTDLPQEDIDGQSYTWILLNERRYLFELIRKNENLKGLILYFLKFSIIFSGIFGLTLGFYTLNIQLLIAMIKIPLLILGTMGICLPALFTFNILLGSKLLFRQTLAVLSVTTYLLSMILVSLSPILLFFIISTQQRNFITLLTVICCTVAGVFGIKLLWEAMAYLTEKSGSLPNTAIIKTWSLIYMFVGTQFAWILRPFIGEKGNFALFRYVEGNFYDAVYRIVINLFN